MINGRPAAAGRLLVQYHDWVDQTQQAAVHREVAGLGASSGRSAKTLGRRTQIVDLSGETSLEMALQAYRADLRVRRAEPDYAVSAVEIPNDYWFNLDPQEQWALRTVGAPAAWDRTHGSSSVLVAVLDSGIQSHHPDLVGKVAESYNFTDALDADDWYGHGTHVAGIIAALTNNGEGVASLGYDTRLLNGKVLGDDGGGWDSWVVSGINWARARGARVINMSLGYAGEVSPVVQDAIDDAWASGVVVVAAAGNDGSSQHFSPASGNHVLAVANTTSADVRYAGNQASNYGSWVDLAAPGTGILSTYSTNVVWDDGYAYYYAYLTGTSMAAPHVSALAALLWATNWGTSAQAVVDRITSTADQIAGTGTYWQYGRINAAAAVVPATQTPTATSTATPTLTATPTSTSTTTPTATSTSTSTVTPTATGTPTSTATPSPTPSNQTIALHSGWNWFSINVQPADATLPVVLSSIAGKYDYVLGESGTYAPPPAQANLNNLTSLVPGMGYMIRMKEAATLTVSGTRVQPATPIMLNDGWHWIGYLGSGSADLPGVLSSIASEYDYLLGESGTYSPTGLPFLNNLTAMQEGDGYLIRMKQVATLVYGP